MRTSCSSRLRSSTVSQSAPPTAISPAFQRSSGSTRWCEPSDRARWGSSEPTVMDMRLCQHRGDGGALFGTRLCETSAGALPDRLRRSRFLGQRCLDLGDASRGAPASAAQSIAARRAEHRAACRWEELERRVEPAQVGGDSAYSCLVDAASGVSRDLSELVGQRSRGAGLECSDRRHHSRHRALPGVGAGCEDHRKRYSRGQPDDGSGSDQTCPRCDDVSFPHGLVASQTICQETVPSGRHHGL